MSISLYNHKCEKFKNSFIFLSEIKKYIFLFLMRESSVETDIAIVYLLLKKLLQLESSANVNQTRTSVFQHKLKKV